MKTLLTTFILVLITHLISFPTGVVLVIMSFLKGIKSSSFKKTFNRDMKLNRFYKNDLYEFASVIFIFAFMYDGFHPNAFEKPLDIPVAIIQICIVFLLLFRGMEEKLFSKKPE